MTSLFFPLKFEIHVLYSLLFCKEGGVAKFSFIFSTQWPKGWKCHTAFTLNTKYYTTQRTGKINYDE